MRELIILFSILFSYNYSLTQERISEYISSGTNVENYIRQVDGKNYLIQIFQNDAINVYELNKVNTQALLHSRSFEKSLFSPYPRFINEYICFSGGSKIICYNFTDNSVEEALIPNGYIFSSIWSNDGNKFVVSIKDKMQSDFRLALYQIGGGFKLLEDKSYVQISGDYLIESIRNEDETYDYILFNHVTASNDTLVRNLTFGQSILFKGEHIYFINEVNKVIKFELSTKEMTALENLEVDPLSGIRLYIEDNILLVVNRGSGQLKTIAYDIASQNIIKEVNLQIQDWLTGILVIKDRILLRVFNSLIIVLNYLNGERIITSSNMEGSSIYEDRFIVNTIGYHGNSNFQIIDLQKMSVTTIDGTFYSHASSNRGIAKVDDKYICAFNIDNGQYYSIFNFDFENLEWSVNRELDKSTNGFKQGSELVNLNNEIVLLADNLYSVSSNSLNLISDQSVVEINEENYKIVDNALYFLLEESRKLMKYNNGHLSVEIDLNDYPELNNNQEKIDYVALDDYLLFSDIYKTIYKYSKIDSSLTTLHHFEDYGIIGMKRIDDHIYFSQERSLFRTDGEEIQQVSTEVYSDFSSYWNKSLSIMKYKGEILIRDRSGIGKLNEDLGIDYIFREDSINIIQKIYFDDENQNLLIETLERYLHYNGSTIFEFGFESMEYYSTLLSNQNGVFLFRNYSSTGFNYRFYDSHSNHFGQIPEYSILGIPSGIFSFNDQYYLATRDGFAPCDDVYIYRLDADFDSFEEVEYFEGGGFVYDISTQTIGNEGLLHLGELFVKLSPEGFERINEPKGISGNASFVDDGERIYFLGSDNQFGIQVFKYDTPPVGIKEKLHKSEITVFPNPVDQFISFTNSSGSNLTEYRIFSITGEKVSSGYSQFGINVSALNPGLYIVMLDYNGTSQAHKFVKR